MEIIADNLTQVVKPNKNYLVHENVKIILIQKKIIKENVHNKNGISN